MQPNNSCLDDCDGNETVKKATEIQNKGLPNVDAQRARYFSFFFFKYFLTGIFLKFRGMKFPVTEFPVIVF